MVTPNIFGQWAPQAYGIWTLVIMAATYSAREWRATRKLSAEDRQARREGFTWQVENLQRENRQLNADLASLRREYDDYRALCHAETDQLRKQVMTLEGDIAGLKRQRATDQVMKARNKE